MTEDRAEPSGEHAVRSVQFTLSLVALIVANLVPLVGVLTLDWDAGTIVLLYWAENLVVGFYTVLRFACLKVEKPVHHLGKLFPIAFFCMHFGLFCSVHGMFLAVLFKLGEGAPFSMGNHWPGPLVFVQMVAAPIVHVWRCRPPGMGWPLIGLLVSHGISFVQNYLLGGEYKSLNVGQVMARPYGRIVLMHVTILAGALPVMLLGSPVPLLVVLIVLKTVVDIVLHNKSHRGVANGVADGVSCA